MFAIYQFFSSLVAPMPIFVILTAISAFLLFFTTRKRRFARPIMLLSSLFLIILSYGPFSNLLVYNLEHQFKQYNDFSKPVSFVVVLGAGHQSNPAIPLSSQLSPTAIIRLAEGISIYRHHKGSKLLVSGFGGKDSIDHAVMQFMMAKSLGVVDTDIIVEPRPRNTAEEAQYISKIVKNTPFVLVTSASHMPRAVGLFRKQNTNPYPAPTNFLSRKQRLRVSDLYSFPNSDGLRNSEVALHEYIGMLWSKLRGTI